MADSLIKALFVKDLEIRVFVFEFNVQCCIRWCHNYQTQWNTDIGVRLTTTRETKPGALAEDKYAIAVINNGNIVGHVPKFLMKLTIFFLKNGGKLHITVTWPRRCSVNLKQGRLELPTDLYFTPLNKKDERKDIRGGVEMWQLKERSRARKKRKRKRNCKRENESF